jgi:hypothetical protein
VGGDFDTALRWRPADRAEDRVQLHTRMLPQHDESSTRLRNV